MDDVATLPILRFYFKISEKKGGVLFQEIPEREYENLFEVVSEASLADYFLLPHNWWLVSSKIDYIEEIEKFSKQQKKKILVFCYGDSTKKVFLQNSIVFRPSVYRSFMSKNEIIMPAYAEDLGVSGISILLKGEKATVGFVGRSKFKNSFDRLKSFLKSFFNKPFKKDGRFFREEAINVLKGSKLVSADFIERSYYSGHLKTVELSPLILREEFINNLKNNHFALSPKGDGNYSLRFYEALSLGRIPVFIDTDMVLPLEDDVDYRKVSISCKMDEIKKIDVLVKDFFDKLSSSQFEEVQKNARVLFEKFLYMPRFLKFVLRKDYLRRFEQ